MASKKDLSGFTPQQRHKIIVDYLKEINKPTKVFHLRWKPGDLLTGKVLETTPMFWYMKYSWGRSEIEAMFYKARCVIGPLFDMALQQTYGGSPGPRWRGAIPQKKTSKWRERQQEKQKAQWIGQQAAKIKAKQEEQKRLLAEQRAKQEAERLRKEAMKNKLITKNGQIWNAISDFGADKSIDYKTFSDNLKDRGINVSPLLSKQLFDQLAGSSGKINKQEMNSLLKKLDQMSDAVNVTWDMLGDKLGCMTIMKRVLLAAGAGEPFNVDDFVFSSKFGLNIGAIQFMGKLADRDVPWDDRVRAMEALSANIGSNPLFNNVLAQPNIPELLCGWATQILDNKPEVQKTAIDTLPKIFQQVLENSDPSVAIGHLEEILDNLFKVLDDPNARRNHPAAKKAVNKLVDQVVDTQDPESVLFLAGLLAEKCDIENVTSPDARKFALDQLQKIMFTSNSPYSKFDNSNNPPIFKSQNLPKKGTINREWLDIATNKQVGPSTKLMTKNYPSQVAGMDVPWDNRVRAADDLQANIGSNPLFNNVMAQPNIPDYNAPTNYTDTSNSPMKGKNYRQNQLEDIQPDQKYSGTDDGESFAGGPKDVAAPYAHVASNPTTAKKRQPVTFDASKSHDCDNDPCKSFLWDFGDDTPKKTTITPKTQHSYDHPGLYPVKVTVTDKFGKTGDASLSQRVIDPSKPNDIGPPYAQLSSNPTESKVNQIVNFDASKSHDYKKQKCDNFIFDFGDGSKFVHSASPRVQHRYDKQGIFPVTVEVTDKYGQKGNAGLQQRVIEPGKPDPMDPYAAVESTPTNAKPNQPVTFDASKSVDCDGDPIKKYVFDFGDKTKPVTSFTPVVKHPFKKPGTYPVKVTVTDKYGKKSTATLSQRIKDPLNPTKKTPPYANIVSNPARADIDEPVTFDASKSHDMNGNPCKTFVWDFGDNSPKKTTKTPIVQHPYQQSGSYPVKVVVTDKNGLSSPASCNQRVKPPIIGQKGVEEPYVAVSSTPADAKPKQPVKLDASKSKDMDGEPCKTYLFDFGDGTPPVESTTPVVNHKYDNPGTYPVSVIATDKYGKKGKAKLSQRIVDPKNPNKPVPPYAHVTSTPQEANPNQPVTFDASKSHDQFKKPCVNFEWDFGDGSPKVTTKQPKTKHSYKDPGSYPVKVVVTDKNGLSSQAGLNQRVRNKPKPVAEDPYANVESTPTNAKPKEPVRFDASKSKDCDGDPCKNFVWDFADNTPKVTTTTPVVNHKYDNPGTYPVKCVVCDKYGRKGNAGLTQRVIQPNNPLKKSPPYAHVTSAPSEAMINQPVAFDASKSHDFEGNPCKSFIWKFGDNTPSVTTSIPQTKHPYKKKGVYPVTVQVIDKNGLKSNANLNQRVRKPDPLDPYANVSSTPPDAKPKQPVKFDASKSVDMDGNPCKNYIFDFGDGTPPVESTKPVINHAYDKPGTYPVNVTVTDKNGRKGNAALDQRIIDPQKAKTKTPPYAHVSSTPSDARPRQAITFDASKSHDMDKQPCKQFIFDFGDGTPKVTSTNPIVKHSYNKPNVYPVTVNVTDKYGQTGTASLQQRVSDPSGYDNDPNKGKKGPKKKNYSGRKGKGSPNPSSPVGKFGSSGKNPGYNPSSDPSSMPPKEIGDEFRNITHDAISKAIMDPNPKNNKDAKKLCDIMAQINPQFPNELDGSAKKRYKNWKFGPMKPTKKYKTPPNKPPPGFIKGKQKVHKVTSKIELDVQKPYMPPI